ncbi:MAG TPA: HAD-IA family hydrolase [Planctomycetota bacterium]|nr:HAD-IA family hydrolase [Planctomycetota bacterium]HRR81904.1 HAD-IA family hydrolase [Planctomycetota bacterium]HRT93711.1 HAD-IA family hydrolase [Planctomycetota bacterium]
MRELNRDLACDAVLLDAAGTLFVPQPSVGAVYATVAREHGLRAEAAALEAGFRAAWRERAPVRFAGTGGLETSDAMERAWWRGTVRRTFELAGLAPPGEACFHALFERFAEPGNWRLFPDALPGLRGLREAGLRLGIVSNFDSRLARICEGLGLSNATDFVLASAEAGFAKPSRRIFDAAVELAGAAASRVLMIGDSPEEDVAGARAAGCRALLLDRSGSRTGRDVIKSLAEVLPRLQSGAPLI